MNPNSTLYLLIEDLQERVNLLENRCAVLEEENIGTMKTIYKISNSLEERINILASEPCTT
jgi:chaperonin cofactor prefoldin